MDNLGWREKLNKFRVPIGLSLVGSVLIIGGIFASGLNQTQPKLFPKESLVESQKMISVDVSGAVNKPGVYKLPDGSRIKDAVSSAGGFTETANGEYISKYLNMAQRLSDGSKIYVPLAGEDKVGSQTGMVAGTTSRAPVNINTASQADLENLPGIGPATAAKIISGRPYQAAEDVLKKKIIGNALFEKIKDSISVY